MCNSLLKVHNKKWLPFIDKLSFKAFQKNSGVIQSTPEGLLLAKSKSSPMGYFQTVDKLDENRVCLFLWLVQFGR
ncbi:hypothetical protein C6W19_24040 [Bacillus sp. RJGP41]|nr:hypothetical protein C6W19_24040 [Bacillus sp. RJGP41]